MDQVAALRLFTIAMALAALLVVPAISQRFHAKQPLMSQGRPAKP